MLNREEGGLLTSSPEKKGACQREGTYLRGGELIEELR